MWSGCHGCVSAGCGVRWRGSGGAGQPPAGDMGNAEDLTVLNPVHFVCVGKDVTIMPCQARFWLPERQRGPSLAAGRWLSTVVCRTR